MHLHAGRCGTRSAARSPARREPQNCVFHRLRKRMPAYSTPIGQQILSTGRTAIVAGRVRWLAQCAVETAVGDRNVTDTAVRSNGETDLDTLGALATCELRILGRDAMGRRSSHRQRIGRDRRHFSLRRSNFRKCAPRQRVFDRMASRRDAGSWPSAGRHNYRRLNGFYGAGPGRDGSCVCWRPPRRIDRHHRRRTQVPQLTP